MWMCWSVRARISAHFKRNNLKICPIQHCRHTVATFGDIKPGHYLYFHVTSFPVHRGVSNTWNG